MTQRDDGIAAILDRFVPPIENPTDDWQRIVADARLDEAMADWETTPRPNRLHFRRSPIASANRSSSRQLGGAIALLAACGLVAVAAVLVFRGASLQPTDAPPQREAAVMDRVLLALSVSNNLVVQETTEQIGQPPTGTASAVTRHEQWADPTNGRVRSVTYGANGQPISQSSIVLTGHSARISTVIYEAHVWQTTTHSLHGPSPQLPGAKYVANMIREQAASGAFTLIGSGMINGRPVFQLRRAVTLHTNTAPGQQPAAKMTINIWVDASDYLPVRQETSFAPNAVSRTTYSWLPPTPANRAKLNLVVPRGFRHTTASSGTTPTGTWSVTSGVVTFPRTHK